MSEPVKVMPMAKLLRLAREKEQRETEERETEEQGERERAAAPPVSAEIEPIKAEFAAAENKEKSDAAGELSLVSGTSQVTGTSLTTQTSLINSPPNVYSETKLTTQTSLVSETNLGENLAGIAESLEYGRGHIRVNHDYFDKIIAQLDSKEQLLYLHLLRYREGTLDRTVILSLPRLSNRTRLSQSTIQRTVATLEAKGMVRKIETQIGRGIEQGARYWLFTPTSLVSGTSQVIGTSLTTQTTIKEKDLKEQNKKGARAAEEIKYCPDCFGSGFIRKESDGKTGVIKCTHSRLPPAKN